MILILQPFKNFFSWGKGKIGDGSASNGNQAKQKTGCTSKTTTSIVVQLTSIMQDPGHNKVRNLSQLVTWCGKIYDSIKTRKVNHDNSLDTIS